MSWWMKNHAKHLALCPSDAVLEFESDCPCFRTIQDRGTDCTMKEAEAIVQGVSWAGELLFEAVELPPCSGNPVFDLNSMWVSEGENAPKVLHGTRWW